MHEDNNTETSAEVTSSTADAISSTPSSPVPTIEVEPVPDVIRFTTGTMVYHRLDASGSPGLIMGVLAQPGHYKYLVRWESMDDAAHFDFELSLKPCIREKIINFSEDDDD